MTRSPSGRILAIFLLLLSAGLVHAQAWVQTVKHRQTAYFLFDGRIERFDLESRNWLASVALPAAGARSMAASDRGVFVAIGTSIHRFDPDLANRTLLTTAARPVAQLLLDDNLLIATQTGDGITALFHPLDGGSPVQSNLANSTWDLLGAASVMPTGNKIFGRSSVRGQAEIVQVTYQNAGGLIAFMDSPYTSGALPLATRTWVMPGETRVVDNSGTVYSTANLTLAGSFGGSFADIAFRDTGLAVVLRGNRLSLHDAAYLPTATAALSAAATSLHLVADAAIAFIPEAGARGVRAEQVAFSSFAPESPATAVSPEGLAYTPDQILMDREEVLLLYSASHKTVFRWSIAEQRYLEGIGLTTTPTQLAYSSAEHALYLGSDEGTVSRIAAVPGSAASAFVNLATPVRGLVATDRHLLAVHYMGSDNYHRTFDRNGVQVDAQIRSTQSRVYEYSPGNRKVFWIHDKSTAGLLHSAVIGSNGILGADVEIPYSKPTVTDTLPVRANHAGTKVILARGVIFDKEPLDSDYFLARVSADMGWAGDTLQTIEPRSGGNTTWNRWTDDWNVERTRVFEGTPLRVIPGAERSVVVTRYGGSPRFHLLDGQGDSIFDSVAGRPPVILVQPQDARTDYGRTAAFSVIVAGSGPYTYRWTRNNVTLPGETSADLVLDDCGSADEAAYQVTVTGAGTVTSATARLGVGPIRNSWPYTPGNLFAAVGDKLYEARTNGQIVRTMQVPNPYGTGFSSQVQDVTMDRLGRLQVIHAPSPGMTTISTFDPAFATWSHLLLPSNFVTSFPEWDLSIAGDTLITNRLITMDVITRRTRLMPSIYNSVTRPNLTGSPDGFAYGGDSNGKVTRYDPRTWELLQTSVDDPTGGHTGAAAAADGTVFAATRNNRLARMAPGSSGRATFLNLPTSSGLEHLDFNVSKSGQIAIGTTNGVILTSTQFQAAALMKLQGVSAGFYAGWVEAPLVPAPSFAVTPPATALEDVSFEFDPLPRHVDPDATLSLALEAGPEWLSLNAGRKLVGTPLEKHIGTTEVRIRATDGFGKSTPLVFSLEVVEVNDTPISTGVELNLPEDTPAFAIALDARFSDEETADADLVYHLLSNSNPAAAAAVIEGRNLLVSPIKDAYGTATFTVRATDAGGLRADSVIRLELTPVNDPPVFTSDVPDLTALPAGSPLSLDLNAYVGDPDPGDSRAWSIGEITRPEIFSQLSVDPVSGNLTAVFAPYVSGISGVTVTVTDGSGASAFFRFELTLPELPLPQASLVSPVTLNRQTGLFEQRVAVTNTAQRDIAGFDLTIRGLPAGVSVNNATGSTASDWIIQHRRVIGPGNTVEFTVEYHAGARRGAFEPQLAVALVTVPESPASATQEGIAVRRCERLEDGALLIEFDSTPGRSYQVQYTHDGARWLKSPVPVTAAANRVQWIDRGPPRTDSPPASVGKRFYRILELPEAP